MTSVGYVNGMDYNFYTKYPTQSLQTGISKTDIKVDNTQTDAYVSETGETCTDGKDDGKIGFFSAIGNAIKGIGKTVVNGVKGMFTNKEGKFSLGKTLLSIGTAALCIAVPAVGVAACVVGGAMGAIQIGKGAYKAATAETDAEAKMAWQDMGGGAFTVAASVVGAKAGLKGMKTGAINSGKGSALQALKDSGTKLSMKNAGQYGKAFLKDGYNSGKYNLGQIKSSATTYAQTAKAEAGKTAGKIKETATAKAGEIKETATGLKQKAQVNKAKTELNNAKTSAEYNTAKANFEQAKANYDVSTSAKQNVAKIESAKKTVTNSVKHPVQTAKTAWTKAKGVVTKDNAQTLWNGIQEAYKNNIKGKSISDLSSTLTGQAKTILTELQNGSSTYAQAVQKYGYDNVAQVLQYLGGTLYSTEAI